MSTELATPCKTNPDAWESPSLRKMTIEATQAVARSRCGDCPLMQQCADYALRQMENQETWEGMIIGGVAVPHSNSSTREYRRGTLAALDAIRRGVAPATAHLVVGKYPGWFRLDQAAHYLNRAFDRRPL